MPSGPYDLPICSVCGKPILHAFYARCLECRKPMHKHCLNNHLCLTQKWHYSSRVGGLE